MTHIRRHRNLPGKSAKGKIDHCLGNIQAHGLNEEYDFITKIARYVTIEELVGALVDAENKLEYYEERLDQLENRVHNLEEGG